MGVQSSCSPAGGPWGTLECDVLAGVQDGCQNTRAAAGGGSRMELGHGVILHISHSHSTPPPPNLLFFFFNYFKDAVKTTAV